MRCIPKPKPPASSCRKKAGIISSPSKAIRRGLPIMRESSTRICRAPFPPQRLAKTCELNRGRIEARCVIAFDTPATRIDFAFAEQAARLTRCTDSRPKPAKGIETEFLVTSRPAAQMSAEQMLRHDRRYWGIETGLHLRLDVVAGEDRSRVRHRNSVMNLAVIRRAVVS